MVVALAVGVCGAIGALSRYGLDAAIERRTESVFPWATFVINVSGCLAVGFVIAALVDRHRAPQWLRAGLVIGFCGGYTTFSTFAQETPVEWIHSGSDRRYALAAAVANPILVAAFARSLSGKPIGERRILLGAVAYAIPYVAIWSIVGFALGATVRAV